ncbi:ParA family protein [Natronolimnohabitans sp. A-GB9]|uniref:ParA family protein n=1 Tax=Natronolimnohabitans sp. A-GB9 TaxID=3069757 RepID=UPI0027B3B7B3|nr:ParA family protein [Natronolimnohabitans sp. A-GB9]MDQ2052695.1 ParA family protein [Natronolimnohabitans sp. A-GB9]
MIPYAIWSEAGGVGKTTLAANLARAHANLDQDVLAIDMDPQDGGLTNHFGLDDKKADSDADNLVLHMIDRARGEFDDLIRSSEGIDLIPSHNNLGNLTDLLSKAKDLEEQTSDVEFEEEKQLRRVLVDGDVPSKYDVLIIDPPASQGQHLYNAVYATSNLLIPFEPSPKGERSVQGLRDVVSGLESELGDIDVGVLGTVPNKVKGTNINQKYLDALEEEDLPIAPVSIGERGSMLGDAWDNQVSIYELAENDSYRDLRGYEEPTLEKFDELAQYITEQFQTPEATA